MPQEARVRITRIDKARTDVPLPSYATDGSAGMDLCAAVDSELTVAPAETVLVPTGFRIELPRGFEAQVRPRSGLAINHQIGITNAPGTIDSDYRGEIRVILHNFGQKPFVIRRGDRIAQMIIAEYTRVSWEEVGEVEGTARGEGGFGHTGTGSR